MEKKTDKQKLIDFLERYGDKARFIDIVEDYIDYHYSDFTAFMLTHLIERIGIQLDYKIIDLTIARNVAKEMATYLNAYLKGEMYTTEEAARKALPIQIEHAQDIIDWCDKC